MHSWPVSYAYTCAAFTLPISKPSVNLPLKSMMDAIREFVIASSSVDAGIGCWDLRSGAEQIRHRPCSSPSHGLISVARRFLVASQIPDSPNSPSSPVFFYSWNKAQVEVKCFPAEPISPLACNSEGTYITGGGSAGNIYLWEVNSGRLLQKWTAHYRKVTCLTFSDDESMLISGSEDGTVRVWSMLMMLDETGLGTAHKTHLYSFTGHSLRVTDVVSGHGLCNSIIVSSSEDRTCKVWSLSKGRLLRDVSFPSIINTIALDPGEHVFYAGCRDGKIYMTALNAEFNPNSNLGMFIIGTLFDHSKAITSLALSVDGVTLVSGSDDGIIRIWDTKSRHVLRLLKYAKGPVSNVIIVREPYPSHRASANLQDSHFKKHLAFPMPPPLERYASKADGEIEQKAITILQPSNDLWQNKYRSFLVMTNQIQELQQHGSGASEMEIERLKQDVKRLSQMVHDWKSLYQELQNVCVNEMLDEYQPDSC